MGTRRGFVALVAASLALPALAQTPADGPAAMTILSPASPGPTDQPIRALAPVLQRLGNQPVAVENRPGQGGAVAAQAVAMGPQDGSLLLFAASALITAVPLLQSTPYTAADFTPVSRITRTAHVLVVGPQSPFATVKDLLAQARAHPDTLTIGTAGAGTAANLSARAFAQKAGIAVRHTQFNTLNEALGALQAGQVDGVVTIPLSLGAQIADTRVKPLVQFGPERIALLPSLPTLREAGVDLAIPVDIGLFGPRGMDPKLLDALNHRLAAALAADEFMAYARAARIAVDYLPAAAYAERVAADAKANAGLVEALGLRP